MVSEPKQDFGSVDSTTENSFVDACSKCIYRMIVGDTGPRQGAVRCCTPGNVQLAVVTLPVEFLWIFAVTRHQIFIGSRRILWWSICSGVVTGRSGSR